MKVRCLVVVVRMDVRKKSDGDEVGCILSIYMRYRELFTAGLGGEEIEERGMVYWGRDMETMIRR